MKTKSKLVLGLSILSAGAMAAGTTSTFAWWTVSATARGTAQNIETAAASAKEQAYTVDGIKFHVEYGTGVTHHYSAVGDASFSASAVYYTRTGEPEAYVYSVDRTVTSANFADKKSTLFIDAPTLAALALTDGNGHTWAITNTTTKAKIDVTNQVNLADAWGEFQVKIVCEEENAGVRAAAAGNYYFDITSSGSVRLHDGEASVYRKGKTGDAGYAASPDHGEVYDDKEPVTITVVIDNAGALSGANTFVTCRYSLAGDDAKTDHSETGSVSVALSADTTRGS